MTQAYSNYNVIGKVDCILSSWKTSTSCAEQMLHCRGVLQFNSLFKFVSLTRFSLLKALVTALECLTGEH